MPVSTGLALCFGCFPSTPREGANREDPGTRLGRAYRAFWAKSTPWILFLLAGDLAWDDARQGRAKTLEGIEKRPAVYEISFCDADAVEGSRQWRKQLKRNVAYVGKAKDASDRLSKYLSKNPGEANKMAMLHKARQSHRLYVRVRYVENEHVALRYETWMLAMFDYAWNDDLNGARRNFPAPPDAAARV